MHIQTKRFVTVVEKGNGIHVLLINLAVSYKENYLESNFKNHLGKCRDCVGGQLTVHTLIHIVFGFHRSLILRNTSVDSFWFSDLRHVT